MQFMSQQTKEENPLKKTNKAEKQNKKTEETPAPNAVN